MKEIKASNESGIISNPTLKNKNNIIEILAPAGGENAMKAAVNAGADAVYMGGKSFGARSFADNFDDRQLLDAIDYLHMHGKKLYLTVNTLVFENEYPALHRYLKNIYEWGVDAVIVQDMGVINYIHKYFPKLPIHLSTQTTLTTGLNDDIFKEYGVTRLVPARELTIGELKKMHEDTGMEIEVFIHGALCYSYSGQCLLSYLNGGRSGNRGMCAGSCRMPYDIFGKRDIYPLSLKENCTLELFGEMVNAGAMSFKIEGRMKKPEYVSFITSIYRKYADYYLEKGYEGYKKYINKNESELKNDIRLMSEIYNREGFTYEYLVNPKGKLFDSKGLLSSKRPNHGGVPVGVLTKVIKEKGLLKFKAYEKLNPHDVIDFRDENQRVYYEYTLKDGASKDDIITGRFKKGLKLRPGMLVYRTRNEVLIDKIRKDFIENNKRIPVGFKFEASEGKKAELCAFTMSYGACSVKVFSDEIIDKAKKAGATKDDVKRALGKLGESIFKADDFTINLEGDLFLPVSVLKDMRRRALDELQDKITGSFRRKSDAPDEMDEEWSLKNPDYFDAEGKESMEKNDAQTQQTANWNHDNYSYASILTREQFDAALESKVHAIVVRMELFKADELTEVLKKVKNAGKKAVLGLPRLLKYEDIDGFKDELKQILEGISFENDNEALHGILASCYEELTILIKDFKIPTEKIITNTGLYTINKSSLMFFERLGIKRHILPYELSKEKAVSLKEECERLNKNYELILPSYGNVPAMLTAACLQKNFKGCRGNLFNEGKSLQKVEFENSRGFLKSAGNRRDFHKLFAFNFCKYCYNEIYVENDIKKNDNGLSPFYYFTDETYDDVKQGLKSMGRF